MRQFHKNVDALLYMSVLIIYWFLWCVSRCINVRNFFFVVLTLRVSSVIQHCSNLLVKYLFKFIHLYFVGSSPGSPLSPFKQRRALLAYTAHLFWLLRLSIARWLNRFHISIFSNNSTLYLIEGHWRVAVLAVVCFFNAFEWIRFQI